MKRTSISVHELQIAKLNISYIKKDIPNQKKIFIWKIIFYLDLIWKNMVQNVAFSNNINSGHFYDEISNTNVIDQMLTYQNRQHTEYLNATGTQKNRPLIGIFLSSRSILNQLDYMSINGNGAIRTRI